MQKVGIVGASGYSGEVLIELLARHPRVGELHVASRTHVGKSVREVLPRLDGIAGDLEFIAADPNGLSKLNIPIWFLALPHGVSAEYAVPLSEAGALVIDLSADFRLNSAETYAEYYGHAHPFPDKLQDVPYLLPELRCKGWKKATLIACPGCYPTSVLIPLLPLLKEKLVDGEGIIINSMSGISGAGKKETLFYSFCERQDSAVPYGLGCHRHLAEIEEQLSMAARKSIQVQFTPHLVPMARGILSTIVLPGRTKTGTTEIISCWEKAYQSKPGVRILKNGGQPDTRQVLGKNRIDLAAFHDKRTGNLILTSAIDNLMKGASGQAVQIMNLRKGWPEFAGLA